MAVRVAPLILGFEQIGLLAERLDVETEKSIAEVAR
jgi:hypothetical protein